MDSFEELESFVFGMGKADDVSLKNECDLIKAENWQDYVLFIVNTINDIKQRNLPVDFALAGHASQVIRVSTNDVEEEGYFDYLNEGYDFSKDGLKLDIVVHKNLMDNARTLLLNGIIEKNLSKLGLVYSEHLVGRSTHRKGRPFEDKEDKIIISIDPISSEEEKVILKEYHNESEKDTLKRYLVVSIAIFTGI